MIKMNTILNLKADLVLDKLMGEEELCLQDSLTPLSTSIANFAASKHLCPSSLFGALSFIIPIN
jgi:hypothetical protein